MAGSLGLGLLLGGLPGLLGAGLATTVVLLVLGLGLAAMIVTVDVAPAAALGVAILTYLLSVLAVGAVLVGAATGPDVSRPAFAVSALAQSAAWLFGMAVAHRRWARQASPPDFPASLRRPVRPETDARGSQDDDRPDQPGPV
jgi:hypothetical protein